jgi:TetR/AcrR family transcriptional repressor of nem operon
VPRPANVSREQILDRATEEFWARGYRAASMDSLVRAIGTTKASLYGEFGGKDGLFEAVLDHYAARVVTEALRPLSDPLTGLAGVERYFRELVLQAPTGQLQRGCLMTTTMTEFGEADPRFADRTQAHLDRVLDAFLGALARARDRGELAPTVTDLRAAAAGLTTLAQGVWASARSGADAAHLMSAVRAVIASMGSVSEGALRDPAVNA